MRLSAQEIEVIAQSMIEAAGANRPVAETVADHLAQNELMGIPAMGLIRVPKYVEQIRSGYIRPNAPRTVIRDDASVFHVDAGQGFGVPAMREATGRAIEKARTNTIAAALVVNVSHTCRIGEFVEMAADAGCFAMVMGGGGHRRYKEVAPFGGRQGVLDTNPYAFAVPAGANGPISADFATSATAQGKMLFHRATRTPVPSGWILDRNGDPTTDPEAFYAGGVMLPAAGTKGYGMAMIAELIGDALLGEPHELNWMMVVLDIGSVRSFPAYEAAALSFTSAVKASLPAKGFSEVMLPGEPERLSRDKLRRSGIEIPKGTRDLVNAAAQSLAMPLPFPTR